MGFPSKRRSGRRRGSHTVAVIGTDRKAAQHRQIEVRRMSAPAARTALFPVGPTTPLSYAPGSPERAHTADALARIRSTGYDVPNIIGGEEVRTGREVPVVTPHDHATQLGTVHWAGAAETQRAIDAALATASWWGRLPWEDRVAPFLRAADLLEHGSWRHHLNAATMLELSKTTYQADIDAACETLDFIRANVKNMLDLYGVQPGSRPGEWNTAEYRPLEGFVFAVTPFNFTCMNNLAFGPAVLGNTVVWKPAESASLVAHLSLQLLREAGLPDGVVNVVYGDGAEIGEVALGHRDLAAVHFTGSTGTFQHIWRTVGQNVASYRNYPRLVGETGGKDFILAHPSADLDTLAAACIRGAYEFQGQKCSAASRLYVPRSLWPELRERLVAMTESVVVGDPTLPETYVGAVINARQHAKHAAALKQAREERLVVVGGSTDDSTGWFVDPTILEVDDPFSPFITEELFAPVLTAYVYEDADWDRTLRLVDESTPYGLTGAVFATDEAAVRQADDALRYTAGNFYVNDKPTGSVVGAQPFGGARASGTNDKAGTVWNLIRFASPRSVKRNHLPVTDYRYPHLES
ncbi:Putative Delta-1-pyrroline-5-carboxylate dehydrogenase (rocA) [Nostocoides japonicum T1-X7]|uniref:L-glutamate gamma-semialdehyde dehydrogenase n=2 Tax=Nostocoides japonicum TaxID=99481 RepID=A0A077LSP0_9MICO|nr:Putative Delta-1-pyrroline-5-carboxylate dehydrogenase (rocA) [Tetrasphaera japonica T1-X7]